VSGQGRYTGHDQCQAWHYESREFSLKSFLAHFVEVTWQPEIARLRLRSGVTDREARGIIK